MPFNVNDNIDIDNLPGVTNLIQAINVLATQIKLLSGKNSWKEKTEIMSSQAKLVSSDYSANNNDILLINSVGGSFSISFPASPIPGNIIKLYDIADCSYHPIQIDIHNSKFREENLNTQTSLKFDKKLEQVTLVYAGADIGWVDYPQKLVKISAPGFTPGMVLWLEGSIIDKSSHTRTVSPYSSRLPEFTIGLDNQPVLRWDGSATQELQVVPSFLNDAISATIYIVFTVADNCSYNLIRTSIIDEYWHWVGDGAGYFGTFQNSRISGYPSNMPNSGSHILSLHANTNNYEVILDGISKGIQSSSFYPGNMFNIVSNDRAFIGDIATLLVYPLYIDKNSTEHSQNIQALKSIYPSLP